MVVTDFSVLCMLLVAQLAGASQGHEMVSSDSEIAKLNPDGVKLMIHN